MKTVAYHFEDTLPYSLHDMTVTHMEAVENSLTLWLENGIVEISNPCRRTGRAAVRFTQVAWDFCYAYVLDFCANEGTFTGRKLFLHRFAEEFGNVHLELTDQRHSYCGVSLQGYLSEDESLKECTLEISYQGDVLYLTEETCETGAVK